MIFPAEVLQALKARASELSSKYAQAMLADEFDKPVEWYRGAHHALSTFLQDIVEETRVTHEKEEKKREEDKTKSELATLKSAAVAWMPGMPLSPPSE